MLRAGHVGRDEKSFILSEDLRRPLFVDGEGTIHEAVCDGGAAGQEERPAFVLAIACLNPCAGGEPVACAAFDGAGIATDSVAEHEAFVRVSIDVLIIDEEVASAEIFKQTFRTYCFYAQIHVLQEGQACEIYK